MATSPASKAASTTKTRNAPQSDRSDMRPVVIYVASSLDGTSFALDAESQVRIRKTFPEVRVSTRHVFVAHDTHELISKSISRFDKQIASLLTGLSSEKLAKKFIVSFRDPQSERELARLVAEPKVA